MDDEDKSVHETAADGESQCNQFTGLLARHDHAIRRFVRSRLPSKEAVDDFNATLLHLMSRTPDLLPQRPGTTFDNVHGHAVKDVLV